MPAVPNRGVPFPVPMPGYSSTNETQFRRILENRLRDLQAQVDADEGGTVTVTVPGGITVTAGAPGGPLLPLGTTVSAVAPAGYELAAWAMWCDPAGDLEVDIRRVTFASLPPTSGDSITGTGRPEITGSDSADGLTTDWSSTTIVEGDAITAVITGVSGVRWFTLTLSGTKVLP